MKKLCVVFPGRRYSTDRSMLYYPSRMIEDKGYEMFYLDYDIQMNKEDPRTLEQCFEECYLKSVEALKQIDLASYEKIIFLSKSIGTVVSGKIKEENPSMDITQVMITPINMTLPYITKNDLVIATDHDRYLPDAEVSLSGFNNAYIFPNVTHSFEAKGDYNLTLRMLGSALGVIEKYLDSIAA